MGPDALADEERELNTTMSMIRNLGEGYYGVEATSGAMSAAVLEQVDEAYEEAMAIPDDAIIITEYQYEAAAPKAVPKCEQGAVSR
jgi:hypothetical protein